MAMSRMLDSDADTTAVGRAFGAALLARPVERAVIYLRGELGAGKTTFARGFLDGLGHHGRVPSPTYTLVEPYELGGWQILHVDLYRLADPGEVDELGLSDQFGSGVALLVEWPERAGDRLEPPDVELTLEIAGEGRALHAVAHTESGERLLSAAARQGRFFA
jgi:tRNA threonylcarbamoyladenosine biosynthesis protein TsaE